MKKAITAFSISILLFVAPATAEPLDPVAIQKIDAYFNSQVAPTEPGRAVTILRDGEIVLRRGYGLAQLEYNVPVTSRTVFHVASLSKQFTAFATLLLAHERKLNLDADVRNYVHSVPNFDQPITVRQLVHHTSGLRDFYPQLRLAGWAEGDVATDDSLRWLLSNQTSLNFPPGTRYQYSNLGYFLLAEVVAKASGMPFPDYLRTHIFEPLGMRHTHFHDDPTMIVPNRAHSYARGPDKQWHNALFNYAMVGATGLSTTAEDLTLWLDNLRTGRLGGADLIRAMQETGTLSDGSRTNYAFGIEIVDFGGMRILTHGGLDAGFRSQLAWIPARNLGIIVLSNSADSVPANDVAAVLQLISGPAPTAAVAAPPGVDTREIAGDYLNSAGMPFTIRPNGVLVFKGREWPMIQTSKTDFVATSANVQIGLTAEGMKFIYVGYPLTAKRVSEVAQPAAKSLSEYVGLYFAPDIQTYYELVADNGRLLLRNGRLGQIVLTQFENDLFVSERLGSLRFSRAGRQPNGFSIPTEKIGPGMVFKRVPSKPENHATLHRPTQSER